jgi:HlyD family secretion protein
MDRQIDSAILRRRMTRRIATGTAIVAGAVLLLAVLPGFLSPTLRRQRLRTAVVERGRIEATVEAAGTVLPAFEKVLSSEVEARVLRILALPGAQVSPGDALLELDTSATRLELDRLEERLAQKENEQKQVRLDLEKTLTDLRSRTETGRLDVEILEYRVEQNRQLHEQELISDAVLREVEVEARKAAIQLRQIEETAESERRSAEARLDGLELDIGILRKEIEDARRRLAGATPRADRQGVLTWAVEEEGATVHKGDVIARIADLDSFRVEGSISDVHAPRLSPGQAVRVAIDDLILPGRLESIHPTIENGVVTFQVSLEQPDHPTLRNNLRVDVLVVTDAREDTLKVRKSPHGRGGSVQTAFLVSDDRARRVEIQVGLSGYEEFEVLEGLEEGDEVIVTDMSDYLHMESIRIR